MSIQKRTGVEVTLSHITKRFSVTSVAGKTFTALDDVSFSLPDGACTMIGGANGSGKSVLMAIIAGLINPTSGSLSVTDNSGNAASAGLVFQEADAQILGETPYEDVMYGPLNLGIKKEEASQKAVAALQKAGLDSKMHYPARFLSGGEKRRLAVAGILAMDLPLVIFDEPYANLDYNGVKQVNELVKMLKKDGRSVIILTHELEKSLGLCDRFIILYYGRKVFDGTPDSGIEQQLEQWGIRNPLISYRSRSDLVWL